MGHIRYNKNMIFTKIKRVMKGFVSFGAMDSFIVGDFGCGYCVYHRSLVFLK